MLPLGHVATGYLCYRLSTRVRLDAPPADGPALVVVFASLLPDLVDKPLAWVFGVLPSGRTLGHSLLFLVPLSIGWYLLARRDGRGEYAVAFAIGAVLHGIADIAPLLWNPFASEQFLLWPLYSLPIPPVFGAYHPPLGALYVLAEFILGALALGWWWRDGCPGLAPIRTALESDTRTG